MRTWAARAAAVVIGVVAALGWAGIAFAHVEVGAEPDTAGAENAVVTFTAEAERTNTGITSVAITLPTSIAPRDVTLDRAPKGWTLTPTSTGYSVGGPALANGKDAIHSVKVTRLPNATEVVFKAIVTYADGSKDRWIEEKSAANPNPDNPAPVLALKPGSGPTAAPSTTPAASATTQPTTTTPAGNAPAPPGPASPDSGGSAWVWWVVAAIVIIGGAAGYIRFRRRGAAG